MVLDLTNGICENLQYKAWKFPGGEIHFQLKIRIIEDITIKANLKSSDDIMFLLLVVDTIKKDNNRVKINLFIPYMAYQQADRNFGVGECFSLKTVCNLINSMELNKVYVFDPHSEVTPALLNNCEVIDNSEFVENVLDYILNKNDIAEQDMIILATDAGSYKKIFKLCKKINFQGQIESCSKSRDNGEITTKVPVFDENKTVLILDDIALGGRTFLKIKTQIKNKCYLAISHGVLNNGGFSDPVEDLLKEFEMIFTTDSRCNIENERVKIFNLKL